MLLSLVAVAAQCLEVANVVATAFGQRDNMVYIKLIPLGLSAALALVAIALKYVSSYRLRNGNSGSFRHYCLSTEHL